MFRKMSAETYPVVSYANLSFSVMHMSSQMTMKTADVTADMTDVCRSYLELGRILAVGAAFWNTKCDNVFMSM